MRCFWRLGLTITIAPRFLGRCAAVNVSMGHMRSTGDPGGHGRQRGRHGNGGGTDVRHRQPRRPQGLFFPHSLCRPLSLCPSVPLSPSLVSTPSFQISSPSLGLSRPHKVCTSPQPHLHQLHAPSSTRHAPSLNPLATPCHPLPPPAHPHLRALFLSFGVVAFFLRSLWMAERVGGHIHTRRGRRPRQRAQCARPSDRSALGCYAIRQLMRSGLGLRGCLLA